MWSELQKAASSRPAHSSPPTTQQLHEAASRILSHFEEEASYSEAFGERSRVNSCASLTSATEEDLTSMPSPEPILAKDGVPLSVPPGSPVTPMLTSAVPSVASLVAEERAETAAESAAREIARAGDAPGPPDDDDDDDDGAGSDFVVSATNHAPLPPYSSQAPWLPWMVGLMYLTRDSSANLAVRWR